MPAYQGESKINHIHKTTNLLDIRSVEKGGLSASTGEPEYAQQVSSSFWHGGSVTFTTTANYRGVHFGFVKVDTNISSTLSLSSSSILTQFTTSIMCYDSDKEFIAESTRQSVSDYFRKFTLAEGTKYIRFAIGGSSGAGTYTAENIMIYYGTTQPAYDPYYISRVYQGENLVFSDILPDEFQEVEYIESSGTQYIDSGQTYDNNTRTFIDYAITGYNTTANNGFLGNWQSGAVFRMYIEPSGVFSLFQFGGQSFNTTATLDVGNRHSIDVDGKNRIVKVGDITKVENFLPDVGEFNGGTKTIRIFNSDVDGNVYFAQMKLFGFKIWDNGMLVSNFIPAKAKVASKNLLEIKNTTRTINGVTFTPQLDGSILVNGTATDNATYPLNVDSSTPARTYPIASSTTCTISKTIVGSHDMLFQVFYGKNGTSAYSTGTFTTAEETTLGAYIRVSSGDTINNEKIYCQLELGSTATPYEQYYEANEAGLYDLVNRKFYTNAGTGDFIAGGEV